MQQATGYRQNMKCTWEEVIVIYKEMVEEVRRDKSLSTGRLWQVLEESLLKWSSMATAAPGELIRLFPINQLTWTGLIKFLMWLHIRDVNQL